MKEVKKKKENERIKKIKRKKNYIASMAGQFSHFLFFFMELISSKL